MKETGSQENQKNQEDDSEHRDERESSELRGERDQGQPECHCVHVTQLMAEFGVLKADVDELKGNPAGGDPWARRRPAASAGPYNEPASEAPATERPARSHRLQRHADLRRENVDKRRLQVQRVQGRHFLEDQGN